jgi:hypothetical protein
MRLARHVVCMGEMRHAYKIVDGKPEGRTALVRFRHKWEDYIKMDLTKIEFGGVDWIRLMPIENNWTYYCFVYHNLQHSEKQMGQL